MSRIAAAFAVTASLVAAPVFAAGPEMTMSDPVMVAPAPAPQGPALAFSLRGGVAGNPAYLGSDEYTPGPDLGFKFHYLRLPNGFELGNPDPWADNLGWDVHGSFNVIGERDPDDYNELGNLDSIDTTVELGLGVGYTAPNFSAFADVRRGFGGHEGVVAELGADAILRPSDRLTLTMGPRLTWGNDEFNDTYFGVPASRATANLPAYDADGGLVSAGVEFGATYQLNDTWGLESALTYDRLTNDAEDSPIVRNGSEDQWGIRFGVTRVIRLGF